MTSPSPGEDAGKGVTSEIDPWEVLRVLVKKLDEVHANEHYQTVWTLHQLRVGPYLGPNYRSEFDGAKRMLAAWDALPKCKHGERWQGECLLCVDEE